MKMLDKILFACLLLLVFSIPFELDFGYMEVNLPLINTSLEVVAALTFAVWIIKKIKDRKITGSPFDIPILAYVIYHLISAVFAENPLWSLKYTFKLSAGIILFYLIIDVVRDAEQIKRILGSVIIASLIVALIGFIEKIFIFQLYEYRPFWAFSPSWSALPGGIGLVRISSTFVFTNILAMYCEFAIFIICGIFLYKFTGKRLNGYFFAALALALALIFTYSRAGLVSLFLVFALISFMCFKNANLRPKFRALVMLGVVLAVLTGISTYFDSILAKRLKGATEVASSSAGQRFFLWKNALKTFREHPLMGVGPDNFRWVYAARYSYNSPYLESNRPAQIPSMDANSLYFESLADLGVIGSLVSLFLAIRIFLVLKENLSINGQFLLCLSLGIMGAFLSYFIHGIFDCFSSFQSIVFMFWITAALGVSARQISLKG